MPKIIDNYVLQDKIGSGQFGDVYKGFNQQTQLQVAIKTIKRETIKGKFYELLENQIKVLKTCDNPYIMKLYALKKTANHYYLILEYCNGGDMLGKIKKHKKLDQTLVVKYLCQILTGFQTLVKHKIMHRDFKLANILLHDDNIKIADFGFSKLLNTEDYTTTMLGSPLNMAPQVLGGNKYNNKADIWSIGACIYEMLYGKPPYMASNMVDLLKNINTKPLQFPSDVKVNPVLIDVLKKMLTPDVKKRISWNDLFSHPINRYLDNLVRKEIDLELIEDESLMINTSKYYLKKNLVMAKPQDIEEKAKLNDQLIGIIKTGEKPKYDPIEEPNKQSPIKNFTKKEEHLKESAHHCKESEKKQIESAASQLRNSSLQQQTQNFSHVFRRNSKQILHYRNIYAFLATVAEQVNQSDEDGAQLAAFVITKKSLAMVNWLKAVLNADQPKIDGLDKWREYKNQHEYHEVKKYIEEEEKIFQVCAKGLESQIKESLIKGELGSEARQLVSTNQPINDQLYYKFVVSYIKPFIKKTTHQTLCTKDFGYCKKQWVHIENILTCLNYQKEFNVTPLKDSKVQNIQNQSVYDFIKFYEQREAQTPEQILLKVQAVLMQVC